MKFSLPVVLMVTLGLLWQAQMTTPSAAVNIAVEALELLGPATEGAALGLQGYNAIGKMALGVAKYINILSDRAFDASLEDLHFGVYMPESDIKTLALFESLAKQLEDAEEQVKTLDRSLRDLFLEADDMIRWEIALDSMEEYIRPINSLYSRFLLYQQLKDKIEKETLLDFARQVVSPDTHSIMSLMAHLHNMAVPQSSLRNEQSIPLPGKSFTNNKNAYAVPNTFENDKRNSSHVSISRQRRSLKKLRGKRNIGRISKKAQVNIDQEESFSRQLSFRPSLFQMLYQALELSDRCHVNQSPQQLVNGLLTLISVTEARGYAMLQFAYMILKLNNQGTFDVERDVAQRLYLQYSEDLIEEAHKVLVNVSKEFYKCEPKVYVEGDSYIRVTELLQGYMENEADLNTLGSCKQNCGYYQHAKSEGCYHHSTQFCGKQRRCSGTLHDCQFMEPDAWVCLSDDPYRRYDYIKYESGLQLGNINACHEDSIKVDSWYRWFVHCSYCLCLCDDDSSPTTDRYISLMSSITDIKKNKVVTGVKFIKKNRIIHIQIQEGQAEAQGHINQSSVQWVNVNSVKLNNHLQYEEGIHYQKLSYEIRSFDLDLLKAPPHCVMTGIRFRMLGSHVNLEMRVTPINYTTGVLQSERSYWISNDNTPIMKKNPRVEHLLKNSDDPTRFLSLHKPDSVPETFIRMGPTAMKSDISQLTVPFFDAQDVAPLPYSWLSGIEIFHKGHKNSGGFLSLKVFTYDVSQHFNLSKNNESTLQVLFTPIHNETKQNNETLMDDNLNDMINENKEGLGVLHYMKYLSDRILYFVLDGLNLKKGSTVIEDKIMENFHRLSQHLDKLESKIESVKSSLQRLANDISDVVRWEIALDTMEEYTRAIHTQYDRFILYQRLKHKVENQTFLEFVKHVVSHDSYSISSLMGHLHSMAAPYGQTSFMTDNDWENIKQEDIKGDLEIVSWSQNRGQRKKRKALQKLTFRSSLFMLLHDAIQTVNLCSLDQSPQELIRGLYLLLAVTQARGFIMIEFAWLVLRVHNEGNFQTEIEMSEHLYKEYSRDILKEAQKVMAMESRDFYKCDPVKYIQDVTYTQLTEFLQGYIENEANFNTDGSCKQNCASYTYDVHQKQCYLPNKQLCGQQTQCSGTLRDCTFVEPDAWVCLSKSLHRRYDYIRYESGLQLGYDRLCNGTGLKVDSWYRWNLYHCSYCACLCDEENSATSDRYISLAQAVSDISTNKIVTGVKFTKENHVIHIKIQQGQTFPNGFVNSSTVEWVDVLPIKVGDVRYTEGIDYKKLSYKERAIDLDRLEAPPDHVVTGIRFNIKGSHIFLQIRVTPINFLTGELQSPSYWLNRYNSHVKISYPRKEIYLFNSMDPTLVSLPNKEVSTPNSFLRFGPTSFESDVAQLTIPFFDTQEVSLTPKTWLSGIDLFHKGQLYSGGFLSFKVITYDYSLKMSMPEL